MAESITIRDAIAQSELLSNKAFQSVRELAQASPHPPTDPTYDERRDAYLRFAYAVGQAAFNLKAEEAQL